MDLNESRYDELFEGIAWGLIGEGVKAGGARGGWGRARSVTSAATNAIHPTARPHVSAPFSPAFCQNNPHRTPPLLLLSICDLFAIQ